MSSNQDRRSIYQKQDRKGPAPIASFEDLSVKSFDLSPETYFAPVQNRRDGSTGYSPSAGGSVRGAEEDHQERSLLQGRRDHSVTFSYKEGYPGREILHPTEGLERQPYIRRASERSETSSVTGNTPIDPYSKYNFRMIDASTQDLRDPIDRSRRFSGTSAIYSDNPMASGERHGRHSSVSSGSSAKSAGSPGAVAIETSFCGPKPFRGDSSFDMGPHQQTTGVGSPLQDDDSDRGRNIYDEINRRMQYPLTKQDSYANAIYNNKRPNGVKKQSSYEQAIDIGTNLNSTRSQSARRVRKQDSYNRAIGGSFEDSTCEDANRPRLSIRKQESYLYAVGEMSPEGENRPFLNTPRMGMHKQHSYQRAIGVFSIDEDEPIDFTCSPRRPMQKQDSYVQAMQFSEEPYLPLDRFDRGMMDSSTFSAPSGHHGLTHAKRQDSYLEAIDMISPDEPEEVKPSPKLNAASWKIRQDSYQQAVFATEDNDPHPPVTLVKSPHRAPKRQDSYVQAMDCEAGFQARRTSFGQRQDSYQKALEMSMDVIESNGQDYHASAITSHEAIHNSWTRSSRPVFSMTAASQATTAAIKIQRAFKNYKIRHSTQLRQQEQFQSKSMNRAAVKIQALFRGFKVRQRPHNVVRVRMQVDNAQKLFKRKLQDHPNDDLADLDDPELKDAATKIQAVFRGFKVRNVELESVQNEMPDLRDTDVLDATKKIQAVFRGYQTRKNCPQSKLSANDLPDLNDEEVLEAAMKIQTVFRGHLVRKHLKDDRNEGELPDLTNDDVIQAAKKIQSVFRGFQVRKKNLFEPQESSSEDLPNLNDSEVLDAALKIQSVFRGFNVRKKVNPDIRFLPRDRSERSNLYFQKSSTRDEKDLARMEKTSVSNAKYEHETKQNLGASVNDRYLGAKRDSLPSLTGQTYQETTTKNQAVFQGYQVRKDIQEKDSLPNIRDTGKRDSSKKTKLDHKECQNKQNKDDLPNLKDPELADAAGKIQAVFRGYSVRKENHDKASKEDQEKRNAINFQDPELLDAANKLTAMFGGYQVQEDGSGQELPDLKDPELEVAANKIQAVFRGFQVRKKPPSKIEDLPDLGDPELEEAANKIQAVFRGFQVRKQNPTKTEDLPDLGDPELEEAANKIQAVFRGFQVRKQNPTKTEDLPDLGDPELEEAANKIQAVFRGFQVRKQNPTKTEDLPDLGDPELEEAANKIQAVFRGFQVRKQNPTKTEDLPDLGDPELEEAANKIQAVFRGFQVRKQNPTKTEDLPDLGDPELEEAANKIQAVFRGFQVRKQNPFKTEDLPDLGDPELEEAANKIQAVFRGFQVRKQNPFKTEDLPDLGDPELEEAANKIQAVFRGFQVRRQIPEKRADDLPNLRDPSLQDAANKIQSVFRGFQVRKQNRSQGEELPDLGDPELEDAANKIQAVFRGFQVRKKPPSKVEDLPDLGDPELEEAANKIQAVFRGFQVRKKASLKAKDPPDMSDPELKEAANKIQAVSRGHKVRKDYPTKAQDLPDFADPEFEDAANKIQAVFRGFQVRKSTVSKQVEDLPDLRDPELEEAANKIQAVFRGFQVRKQNPSKTEDLPDLKDPELEEAANKIQAVFRGFQVRKHIPTKAENLPDLGDPELEEAANKIQAVFRGFKVRKQTPNNKGKDDLLNLNDPELEDAANKIQAVFRGFRVRKQIPIKDEDLPDLQDPDVEDAANRIQSVFRGFQVRKKMQSVPREGEELPNLDDYGLIEEANKIQDLRKPQESNPNLRILGRNGHSSKHDAAVLDVEDLPKLSDQDVVDATKKIQSVFRGYQVRKDIEIQERKLRDGSAMIQSGSNQKAPLPLKVDERDCRPTRPFHSITTKSLADGIGIKEVPNSELLHHPGDIVAAAITIQRFFRKLRVKDKKSAHDPEESTSSESELPRDYSSDESQSQGTEVNKAKMTKKRPPPPPPQKIQPAVAEKSEVLHKEPEETDTFNERSLNTKVAQALQMHGRTSSSGNTLSKTPAPSLDFDNVEPMESDDHIVSQTFGVHDRPIKSPLPARSSKLKQVPIPIAPQTPLPVTSAFAPPPPPASAASHIMSSSFTNTIACTTATTNIPSSPSVAQNALGIIRKSSLGNFFTGQDDSSPVMTDNDPRPPPPPFELKPATMEKKSGFFSTLLRRGDKKKKAVPLASNTLPRAKTDIVHLKDENADLGKKDDLIHSVISAVEENWLKQAPQPTVGRRRDDRSSAESDLDGSELEEPIKTLQFAPDEGQALFRQDSNGEELPYLETTLPQERSGLVTLTPSYKRIGECKLSSITRPRSASPKNPGRIQDFGASHNLHQTSEKIVVKLPKQDSFSRIRPRPESWESFSSKGLQTFKGPLPEAVKQTWVDCDRSEGEKVHINVARRPAPPPIPTRSPCSTLGRK
ncbi:hypothetical protein TCAL_03145 [Tigriopus californicus]|uniref:Uncharacterized protein n=1 Tax=Tigriopus californicus TaxID=6832 RepID=A0A553P216_TIGCA|nr:hypothetical protein TCAL_03145 [Tigriopus californicus]